MVHMRGRNLRNLRIALAPLVGTFGWTPALGRVALTAGGESAVWRMTWQGQELTPTFEGRLPTNVIVLQRPEP
jgi:hypothetical protein